MLRSRSRAGAQVWVVDGALRSADSRLQLLPGPGLRAEQVQAAVAGGAARPYGRVRWDWLQADQAHCTEAPLR